jgi:hypothetical protein
LISKLVGIGAGQLVCGGPLLSQVRYRACPPRAARILLLERR